jgi:hypothetical protein
MATPLFLSMPKEQMRQRPSTSVAAAFLITAFSVALFGCASLQPQPPTPQQQAEQIEPMLSAAGFRMLPADTPERQKQLDSLLPLQVQYYIGKTGNLHYWMADPNYCKCMYIGTEEAYQKYEKLKLDEQFQAKEGETSQRNLEAQQMEEMDMQEEMFNPYGMGLVGPMGPAMYW